MKYSKVGVIIKPHGLQGAAVCLAEPAFSEVFSSFKFLFINHDGSYVPYRIAELSTLNAGKFKLHLDGLKTKEEVEEMRGVDLFQDDTLLPKHVSIDFVGYTVMVEDLGELGNVSDVIEQPTQLLLEVSNEHRSWLIPLVPEYILSINDKKAFIHLELPEGLLDL
ncbi:MAG: ribosome maturation factor RimM [Salibacteraceae bacterium]